MSMNIHVFAIIAASIWNNVAAVLNLSRWGITKLKRPKRPVWGHGILSLDLS